MLQRFYNVRFDEAMALLAILLGGTVFAILYARRARRRTSKSARFDIAAKEADKPQ